MWPVTVCAVSGDGAADQGSGVGEQAATAGDFRAPGSGPQRDSRTVQPALCCNHARLVHPAGRCRVEKQSGSKAAHRCAQGKDSKRCVEILLRARILEPTGPGLRGWRCRSDILEVDSDGGQSIIHHAIDKRNFDIVPWLVQQRADINHCCDTAGFTPLMNAVVRNHVPSVELLAKLGARLGVQSKSGAGCGQGVTAPAPGISAIGIAARKGQLAMVETLLQAKANADAHAVVGAMAYGFEHGKHEVSILRAEHKGDLATCKNADGSGALHVAASHRTLKKRLTESALEWLAERQATERALDMQNSDGVTALMVAARHSAAGDVRTWPPCSRCPSPR